MASIDRLVTASYADIAPSFASPPHHCGTGAAVLGRAEIGSGAWLGSASVIRADGNYVQIGSNFFLGRHGTVHINQHFYPTHIGDQVTAADHSVIHACDIGDNCILERGTVVLDGSTVEPGVMLAPGSVVYPRSKLKGGWLYAGQPAKQVRKLESGELDRHHARIRAAGDCGASLFTGNTFAADAKKMFFVAPTAQVTGNVITGKEAGIWYGCNIDAGAHSISIGARTNIQDNSSLVATNSDSSLGDDVTIGHNVTMRDCVIGSNCLIGIGSQLAPGTIVEEGVMVAAGSRTLRDQTLQSGYLWAGQPARQLAPLDTRKRDMMAGTIEGYVLFAAKFREEKHSVGL